MNLTLKLLWIDDDKGWVRQNEEDISDVIKNNFFSPCIVKDTTIDENNVRTIKHYDLILVDYNLSNNEKGDKIIELIRQENKYSDIIFYSSQSDFPENKNNLTGVWYVNREEIDELVDELSKKIIGRSFSVSSIRGTFVDVTSTFDDIIDIIFYEIFNASSPNVINLTEKIKEGYENSLAFWGRKRKEYSRNPIDFSTYSNFSDNVKPIKTRVKILGSFINSNPELLQELNDHNLFTISGSNECTFDDDYINDIINTRNSLAHFCKESDANGNEYIYIDDIKTHVNQDFIENQRSILLTYQEKLSRLKNIISSFMKKDVK